MLDDQGCFLDPKTSNIREEPMVFVDIMKNPTTHKKGANPGSATLLFRYYTEVIEVASQGAYFSKKKGMDKLTV
jgi:hypothetical protein